MFKKLFSNFRKKRPGEPVIGDEESLSSARKRFEDLKSRGFEIDENVTAEELCGVRDGMTEQELSDQLAMLYRRHNRAASSLDERMRVEAEVMLDAIVECRQRYLGGA